MDIRAMDDLKTEEQRVTMPRKESELFQLILIMM